MNRRFRETLLLRRLTEQKIVWHGSSDQEHFSANVGLFRLRVHRQARGRGRFVWQVLGHEGTIDLHGTAVTARDAMEKAVQAMQDSQKSPETPDPLAALRAHRGTPHEPQDPGGRALADFMELYQREAPHENFVMLRAKIFNAFYRDSRGNLNPAVSKAMQQGNLTLAYSQFGMVGVPKDQLERLNKVIGIVVEFRKRSDGIYELSSIQAKGASKNILPPLR